MDLDNLTTLQKLVANDFLDALLRGETVSHADFPELSKDEFQQLADAIVAAVAQRH